MTLLTARKQNRNLEQRVKREITRYLQWIGAWVVWYPATRGAMVGGKFQAYTSAHMPRGVPDIHATIRGRSVWIEVKRPGAEQAKLSQAIFGKPHARGKLSREQAIQLELIKRAGGLAFVAYGTADVQRELRAAGLIG